MDDKSLTSALARCQTLDQLYALFGAHHKRFNRWHVACIINRLAKVRGAALRSTSTMQGVAAGIRCMPQVVPVLRCLAQQVRRPPCHCPCSPGAHSLCLAFENV